MHRFGEQRHAGSKARAKGRGRSFMRSEDGSLIIFGLMIFILMLLAGGMGVDFMRYEAQRARLQATLDRAVLAAASMDQPLDPEAVVLDYFQKAGLGNHINAGDITITDTLTSRRVAATASLTIGASFLRFAGIEELVAPAAGAAEESASQTEISLVLDTSGSMGWASASGYSKIYELRKAAKQFVNIVLCDPAYPDQTAPCVVEAGKVSVSIVPYSEQVLVGETLLGYFNPTTEHTNSSCVTFEPTDFSSTSISPTQSLQRTGHFDPWRGRTSTPSSWTCKTNSWREITAVSGDAAVLRSHINSLGSSGNTSIDVATKWGAAFLDPAAQPVVSNLVAAGDTHEDYDGRPLGSDERGVEKVIVLMTDGVNTDQHYLYDDYRSGPSPIYNSDHASASNREHSLHDESTNQYYWLFASNFEDYPMDRPYGVGLVPDCDDPSDLPKPWRWDNPGYCTWVDGPAGGATQVDFTDVWTDYTWNWWNQWDFLSAPGDDYGNATKNTRLQAICSAAKEQDITVFSVGFEVTTSSATVMRDCASSDAHYFDASGLDLTSAFAAIAREISKLRLVN